jgi:hypothetical protein
MAKAKQEVTPSPTEDTKAATPDLHIYEGHEVELVGQSYPEAPGYVAGADPTVQGLVKDWRGMHHTVNVLELEPPGAAYPPPPDPDEGASGAELRSNQSELGAATGP